MKHLISTFCFFLFIHCFAQQPGTRVDSAKANNILYFSILKQSVLSVHYERIFHIHRNFMINPHVGTGYIPGEAEKNVPSAVNLYHGFNVLAGAKNFYLEAGADFVLQGYGGELYYSLNGNFGLRYQPVKKESVLLSLTYNPILYTSNPHNDFDVPYGFSIGYTF